MTLIPLESGWIEYLVLSDDQTVETCYRCHYRRKFDDGTHVRFEFDESPRPIWIHSGI